MGQKRQETFLDDEIMAMGEESEARKHVVG